MVFQTAKLGKEVEWGSLTKWKEIEGMGGGGEGVVPIKISLK